MIKKDTWVRIHRNILEPGERAPGVPEDTAKVPLELWVKGYLQKDAEIGDEVEVVTLTGRRETGKLLEANHAWPHNFGSFVPEFLAIDAQARRMVWEGADE
jgi:hypothetical protein